MNRLHVSARLRAFAKSGFLILALVMVSTYASGCDDSTPTCTNCTGPNNGTPFTPGSLPGSAISVEGGRCGALGSELSVFGGQLLATRIADPTTMSLTFAANDPFVVYWSVCNIGSSPSAAVTTLQGVHIAEVPPGPVNDTQTYSIPALDPCHCVEPIPQRPFASGLAAGNYDVNLIGLFDTKARITIN